MKEQARPYMAVVANGFVRRVGVGLAGPEWCSIPVGKKGEMRERESGVGLALSRCACELGGSSEGARSRISSKGHWNVSYKLWATRIMLPLQKTQTTQCI